MANYWWKGLGYNTKHKLEEHIRRMMTKYPNCVPLGMVDQEFMTKVLTHHHSFVEKCGDSGLAHYIIDMSPERPDNSHKNKHARCFYIVRNDGSRIDISWIKAIKPSGNLTDNEIVSKAARNEVTVQIREFRTQTLVPSTCELCGGPITPCTETEVDHIVFFKHILETFLALHGYNYKTLKIKVANNYFTEPELANHWREYHKENATLRIVHASCNAKRPM